MDVPPEHAAPWVEGLGADGLVLTGADFADNLARIRAAPAAGVRWRLLIGGGVKDGNVREALATADGAFVSSPLMRSDAGPDKLLR